MRRTRDLAALAIVLVCTGCASMVSVRWLPWPSKLTNWPYGAAVRVRPLGPRERPVIGELLAVGGDSVYVLTEVGLRAVACRQVREVWSQADRQRQLRTPYLRFPRGSQPAGEPISPRWGVLRRFARFPGGLPDSLDRANLTLPPTGKPYVTSKWGTRR